MFALDTTFLFEILYVAQTDSYLKGVTYFTGIIIFLEILRNQVSEINLLQLIPGFYFLLYFLSFISFYLISETLLRIPAEIDNLKGYGTKVTSKLEVNILLKTSFFLFSILLFIIFNSVIPLSLDSFNSSGEKTLDNLWSFSDVLSLELVLLLILTIISQLPLFFILNSHTQKDIFKLSKYWKLLIVFITLIAGILTPTLDGYTQISFALCSFVFYLFIINFLQKRILLKFPVFLPFGG